MDVQYSRPRMASRIIRRVWSTVRIGWSLLVQVTSPPAQYSITADLSVTGLQASMKRGYSNRESMHESGEKDERDRKDEEHE